MTRRPGLGGRSKGEDGVSTSPWGLYQHECAIIPNPLMDQHFQGGGGHLHFENKATHVILGNTFSGRKSRTGVL